MAFELTPEQESRAREAFMAVLDAALPAYELVQRGLFENREEEFIHKEVERKRYEPALPNGGGREQAWARRLEDMARDREWEQRQRSKAQDAAKKWREVDGWYYQRKPPPEKTHKAEIKWLREIRDAAHEAGEWDKKWFAQMCLDGLPERVADFKMTPLYLLAKPSGQVDRLVRLRNVLGETAGPVALPPKDFHASEYFRHWCLSQGSFNFLKGRDELMKLHLDTGRAVAWRKVNEVEAIGWHPIKGEASPDGRKVSGIWFNGDSAYVEGKRLEQDDDGIYWHDGEGYMVPNNITSTYFPQKLPLMFPKVKVESLGLEISEGTREFFKGMGTSYLTPDMDSPLTPSLSPLRGEGGGNTLAVFFREMTDRLRRTTGGLEAYLVVGSFAAYAAAPEIFEEYSQFPGPWLHGQAGSGKSTIMEWMMELWGFQVHAGLSLKSKSVSAVGLLEAANHYSNLPLWADEFKQGEVDEDKIGVLHNAFNRSGQLKYNPNNVQRQMRTVFVVSGESTSNSAALRGRYAHVQVSAMRRETDASGALVPHAKWFQDHRRHFYQFGRFLLERRAEFTELTLSMLRAWRSTSQGVSERDKLVYGVPYAAFKALSALLESHDAAEMAEFKTFTMSHAGEASEDVVSELNINIFWTELLNAYKAGEVPRGCFRVEVTRATHAPQRPHQTKCGMMATNSGWNSYRLFIDPAATLSALQQFLTKQRASIPLKQKDLRDQLSKNPYWVNGKQRQRFNLEHKGAGVTACWAVDLDTHPMGYMMASDAEYDAYVMSVSGEDPRMGELYLIVNAVMEKEKEKEGELR